MFLYKTHHMPDIFLA